MIYQFQFQLDWRSTSSSSGWFEVRHLVAGHLVDVQLVLNQFQFQLGGCSIRPVGLAFYQFQFQWVGDQSFPVPVGSKFAIW